ncbi:MAG: amino acid ABC transporter substrate-binding protein [Burkholderiales bacterium]
MRFRSLVNLVLALGAVLPVAPAQAGDVLDAVKARGLLRCGVSEGIAGFSEADASGRWHGMDADFCRAVAAAVLGDAEKVQFVSLKSSMRFPALVAKRIDLLARNTTWTLTREALLKVQFPGVLFYDGQAFMVAKSAGIKALAELDGATVCVEKGTTHQQRLADVFAARGLAVKPLVIDSSKEVAEAFFAGRCRAYTSDASQLAAVRVRAPGGAQEFAILPERVSKEPLGPVVSSDDIEWVTLVRWVLFALIAAEERGVMRANIDSVVQRSQGAAWRLVSGTDERLARALGVQRDWVVRAVQAGGNYGEIYDRNLGRDSALNIARGPNRLWTQGGLLYAPPID